MKPYRLPLYLVIGLGLAGCVLRPVDSPPPSPPVNQAVADLLVQAKLELSRGQLNRAGVLLERSLEIDAREARVWSELAALRLEQQQYQAVIQLASKSNSLSQGQALVRKRNWRLIAEAYERLGNQNKAAWARQKAEE